MSRGVCFGHRQGGDEKTVTWEKIAFVGEPCRPINTTGGGGVLFTMCSRDVVGGERSPPFPSLHNETMAELLLEVIEEFRCRSWAVGELELLELPHLCQCRESPGG